MAKPIIAIVGRPNVGKSTLFNRIIGRRLAIVEDTPGITRDRLYANGEWCGQEFTLIDTGGIILQRDEDPLIKHVRAQAELAIQEADAILFIVDAKEGLNPVDQDLAEIFRKAKKPVILTVNKADNSKLEVDSLEFYSLGLGEVSVIAANSGRGIGDLLDRVVNSAKASQKEDVYPEDALKISLVGRPNVGKSSLTNAILGENRVIVSEIPGTTRDSIDTYFQRGEDKYILIDTAGIRRQGKIQGSVEYYCVLRSQRAIERSDVSMLVISAEDGLADGDKRVGGTILDAGCASLIVVNKWDMVENVKPDREGGPTQKMQEFADFLHTQMPYLAYLPIIFTSAETKMGVDNLLTCADEVAQNHNMRIPTSELNKLLREATERHPYNVKGRVLKIRYATMASVKPPTIILFVNNPELLHFSYLRYLENQIRDVYGFQGTPLRIFARKAGKEDEG